MDVRGKNEGVSTVEYSILLVLIALALAVASPNISSAVIAVFAKTSSLMNK